MHEPLEGIAQADAVLGRAFPLPAAALPLARWVDIARVADRGVEVAWSLDDSRPGTPGRLALYAGSAPPPARRLDDVEELGRLGPARWLRAPLAQAQPSLRPVHQLSWEAGDLHLRMTAQGPWQRDALAALVAAIVV